MPPTVEDRWHDIRESIAEIESILSGVTREQFIAQRRLRLLTERLLEITCEASRRPPDDIKQQEPLIEWQKVVDFGNYLRHAYHSTRAETVWDITQNDLPLLKAVAERHLGASGN
jgi:uncharacterized protein with HEPN domain